MHPKCGPKEGHCKETYKYSIKRVKYARYMRTKFRSQHFFTVKRQFSPFASRVLDTPGIHALKMWTKRRSLQRNIQVRHQEGQICQIYATNFRSLQFFTVKRLFSPFASGVLDTPWHSCTQNADQKKVTARKHTCAELRGSNMSVICGPILGLCNFSQWKGYFHHLQVEF